MMLCALVLVTLVTVITGNQPGVKVSITQRGLDYAVTNGIKQVLQNMKNEDQTGTEQTDTEKVEYSFKGIKFKFDDFESKQNFVSGTGVSIAVKSTKLDVSGDIQISGNTISKVFVDKLSISATVAVKSDGNGHLTLSMDKCSAEIGSLNVQLQDSVVPGQIIYWLNFFFPKLFSNKICSRLQTFLPDLNTKLKTLNVKVGKHVEIDYSLMSADISANSIEVGLKGVFYNTNQHIEPLSPPPAFSLASHSTNMFYIAVSAFTIKSAFMVLHNTGVFNIKITDDMVPSVSPIRLSTTTFGAFIPQISETHPDLKLELNVKTEKEPIIKFEQGHVILQLLSTVTVTAVQSDDTTNTLFVLDLESVFRVQVSVVGDLFFDLTLEKIKGSMNGRKFQVEHIDFLTVIIHNIMFPIIKAHLAKGFQLPGLLGSYIGKVHVINPQVKVLKDYVLIGIDIEFGENTSS